MPTKFVSNLRRFQFAVLLAALSANPAWAAVGVNVDPDSGRAPISPYIYGTNQDIAGVNFTLRRNGGNRMTGYNWENNASNAGSDYLNQSDNYLTYISGIPDSQAATPGIVLTNFHDQSLAASVPYSIITLPMAGYVAADKSGPVAAGEAAPSARWIPVVNTKPTALSATPNLTDGKVYSDELVQFLVGRYGSAASATGIKGYDLDNEPDLWSNTHSRLHPAKPLCTELISRSVDLAKAVKRIDPAAETLGFVSYGFGGYYDFQSATDWPTEKTKGSYRWFIDYYLDQMKQASTTAGTRLLDVLDLHNYSEAQGGGARVTDSTDYTNIDCNKARLQAPRAFWDPTYVENSWIGQYYSSYLPFLTGIKQSIATFYPGTKLGFSEYNFGGENHISGGIAQADILGIFGKQGVYLASLWPLHSDLTYTAAAFKLYRNYDGAGNQFGNTTVSATTADAVVSSVYASLEGSSATRLHVIVLNKSYDTATQFDFNVAGSTTFTSARVFAFDATSATLTERAAVTGISGNHFSYSLPPLTAAHFILQAATGMLPVITTQPVSRAVFAGSAVTLSGGASGSPSPTYQWQKNGVNINGATGSSYTIAAATNADAGSYTVIVTNAGGSVSSNAAILTVISDGRSSAATSDFDGDGQSDLFWQNTVTGERSFWLMNGTTFKVGVSLGTFAPDWTIVGSGDFNGDGQTDLLWQNTITGERTIWLMNGTTFTLGVNLGTYSTDIRIMGSGDFNGDGQTDIVVENTITGEATVWLMNGTTKTSEVSLGIRPTAWSIAGTGDFNGDGKTDLIWQNAATGERTVWLMNGTTMSSEVSLGIVGKQFQIVGTGDYNRDGKTDLVWTDTSTGDRSIWLMNGLVHVSTAVLSHVSPEWSLDRPIFLTAQTAHADFNADGQTDFIVQNSTTGERTISFMTGAAITSTVSLGTTSTDWVISGTGDFNQDDKPDLVWSNTVTGEHTVWLMNGSTLLSKVSLTTLSPQWVISAIGDFNYDGKPDIVWTNTATGERAIWLMNGTVFGSGVSLSTVPPAWKIVTTADLNGDGKTDLIWQNTSTGESSVWLMNGGSFSTGVTLDTLAVQWSIVGTGDFNADGKADLLLQNTATGERVVRLMNRTTLLSTVSIGTDTTDRLIRN